MKVNLSNIGQLLEEVSSKFEVLSNPLRLLILAIVLARSKVTWTEITKSLENLLNKDINPNSISFHLKKLQETGYVELSGSQYMAGKQVAEILGELQPLVNKIRSESS